MKYIGIDIGSTCAKTTDLDENGSLAETFVIPTGWSSFEALDQIKKKLSESGIKKEEMTCVSTGYGRAAVDFADKKITEITCHARGAVRRINNIEFAQKSRISQWEYKQIFLCSISLHGSA